MQSSENFRLIVRRGPQPNQAHDLAKDVLTLGRDITNDLVINDPEVSRHHLRMTRGAGGFTLEDLGSTNGTFVNGQRLSGARLLRPGDMVGLGETVTLVYEQTMLSGTVPNAPSDAPAPSYPSDPAPAAYQPPPGQQVYVNPASPPPQYNASPAPIPYTPPQPSVSGYQPPASTSQPYASPNPYNNPASPASVAAQQPAPGGYSYTPPYGSPPVAGQPGYPSDYDPYAVREDAPRNTTRTILIGCGVALTLCCCGSAVGLFAVDQLCLWESIPLLYDVLTAFGYSQVCV